MTSLDTGVITCGLSRSGTDRCDGLRFVISLRGPDLYFSLVVRPRSIRRPTGTVLGSQIHDPEPSALCLPSTSCPRTRTDPTDVSRASSPQYRSSTDGTNPRGSHLDDRPDLRVETVNDVTPWGRFSEMVSRSEVQDSCLLGGTSMKVCHSSFSSVVVRLLKE